MISTAFKQFLADERHSCNALFASVQQQYGHVDMDSFNQFLLELLDPCVARLADNHRAVGEFARAGYQHGLELASRRWLGASEYYPYIKRLWREVIVECIATVNSDPDFWLASLANALNQLHHQSEQAATQWLDLMAGLSSKCQSLDELQRISVISAWVSGLACYREAALHSLQDLRSELFIRVFHLPENADCAAIEKQLNEGPWFAPHLGKPPAFSIQRRVGGAAFFEGEFSAPPRLIQHELSIYVKSGDSLWLLFADFFGQMLIPVGEHSLVTPAGEQDYYHLYCELQSYNQPGVARFLREVSTITSLLEHQQSLFLTSTDTFSVIVFNC